jgi:hypothetical protein
MTSECFEFHVDWLPGISIANENNRCFEFYVDWLPGMSIAKLEVVCEYSPDTITDLENQIKIFCRKAKECALREMANDSVKCKMSPNPERFPGGTIMYFRDMVSHIKLRVMPMDHDNTLVIHNIDNIENIIQNNILSHTMQQQSIH